MDILDQAIKLLEENGIDINTSIDFDVNGKVHTLSYKYTLRTYMLASQESQLVFYTAMQKALQNKEMGAEKFFEGMGQLLLMSHLSEKFQTD